MGAVHLCWCLGLVLLVLPNLDARNVKIVPAETKTITTNGATHEISRYILVPDDQNNENGAKTIADAITLKIASRKGVDKAQSIETDDIKDINEINTVKTDDAKESKFENVHDLIKTIHIMHAKHGEDGENIKSEIPASVKYHHFTGSHIKNNNNHSKHENTEVIGNWHKIKNNGKSIVEHTRVILNIKPQHKVAQSKVIYIKQNNEGKEETKLKKSALKMHFQGQSVQAASRNGFGLNEDENTVKDDSVSKITKIKYSELPIKWDLIKSEDKGDLTSIGINKTFTIPGKRGRFKLLHEHDDDYDVNVAHEKHTIQHYPLPKHKTVTHYYTSKYTVGRTVHGQNEKNDLSLRLHKIGTNSDSSAIAHETNLDKNNNMKIGLLSSNSNDHVETNLYKNVNNDENKDGEIITNKYNKKISSAPVNVIKSNSIYTNTGVVNLQAETLSKHEDDRFLLKENHSDERKQSVHLDTHSAQIKQKIVDAHVEQSSEDTDSENTSEVAPIHDNLDTHVLIENRNNIDDTEPTANDKIEGDFSQSIPNELVFPLEDNIHSAESYEIHDSSTSSEHDIVENSSIENRNSVTSKEHSTEEHGLDNDNGNIKYIEDVSQSNPNEISFPAEDNIHSDESYDIHDAGNENATTKSTNTDTPNANNLSTSSEHDIVENSTNDNLNSVTSKEHSAEEHNLDDASAEIINDSKTDDQVVNKVHTTPKVSETSVSDESEELTDTTTEHKVNETNTSVENEEPETVDAIERSTEELGNYDEITQSPSSVPIESESSVSDEVEEPKIDYATEPSSEELGNENNVTVPGIDSTVVSTVKTVPISGETNINSASQEPLYDAAEPSSEELEINEKPAIQQKDHKHESNQGTVPTAVSVETEGPGINYVSETSDEVQDNHNNINDPETDNTFVSTVKSVPISDETSTSSESEAISQETPEPSTEDLKDPVTRTENKLEDRSETVSVDETSVSDETEKPGVDDVTELSPESLESDNNIIVSTTKSSESLPVSGETHGRDESDELVVTEADNNDVYNVETTSKVEDTSINDESVEPEIDDATGFSPEVLRYVDEDNISETDEVDDKKETVPTVDVPSNETEESKEDDSAVPEDNLSVEHSEEEENKFTPAESLEQEDPKDITDLPTNDLSESSTESNPESNELTPGEILQLEDLYKQILKSTEATDGSNNPVPKPQTDYKTFEPSTPSQATSDEITEPNNIEPSQPIPEPEMNDYDSDEYEIIEPAANDKELSQDTHSAELSDREEAREEHESTHPTVNGHLTRFPISGQASVPYPSTYNNGIAYPNLANTYSVPNAISNQPNAYVTSDQYLQYILGYLTSANVMQQLRQKYAQGYGDIDKIRQMHIIGHLQNLGVHRIGHEQYLVLAQNVKQLEDVQKKDSPKAEIINDDQADNQDIPKQYYYMPYANVYPSVQTPKLNNAYIQRYLLQNVDVNASNTAAQALSDRVLNIVTYLRKLRVPEYRISQFVTEVKKHLTPAAIQSYMNDCKNKVVTGLREKIDILAKQAMQRCMKCSPPVYALSQNYS